MTDIATVIRTAPMLVIHDAAQARGLAEALIAGGLKVTPRTPAALAAMRAMRRCRARSSAPARSCRRRRPATRVRAAPRHIVSPGLARTVLDGGTPYLPGVATAGDVRRKFDLGSTISSSFWPRPEAGR